MNDNTTSKEVEFINAIENQYDVDILKNTDGSYEVIYRNGEILNIAPINENSYYISGSKISFEIKRIDIFDRTDSANIMDSFSITSIPDSKEGDNNLTTFAAPCNQHPSESFDECFKREMDEFCDGFAGCTSLAFFPELIIPIITGHCLAC